MSLWKKSHAGNGLNSPQISHWHKKPHILRETSLCICQKASFTVEAAVIIPCMAVFFTSILFFFRILQVQYSIDEALLYAGQKTAIESSAVTSQEILLASAKGYVLYALKDNEEVSTYVKGGSLGVLLLGSDCDGEEIYLRASYEVSLPIDLWGVGSIRLYSQNWFQKWNGDVTISEEADSEEIQWVYTTPNGTVYHSTSSCRVLNISVREVLLSEIAQERGKDGQKYYECSRCKDLENKNGYVYCTDYGTLYHMDISCSSLKRTIQKVLLEEVGERKPCSFCD